MSSPVTSPVELTPDFRREHGIHTFTVNNDLYIGSGENTVSVISHPDLESYLKALESAPSLGDVALSPELMTLSGESEEVKKGEVESGIKEVVGASSNRPNTLILLGTPTFPESRNGNGPPKPSNSLLFICNGKIVANTNQQFPGGSEDGRFSFTQEMGNRSYGPGISAIVGGDFVGEGLPEDDDRAIKPPAMNMVAQTALVSVGGLYVPGQGENGEGARSEEATKALATMVFERWPHLSDIVMADRVPDPAATGAEGPLNAHFVRQAA